jgi:hypothetical protein
VGEPIPLDAELAAKAAGRRAPVLNPQEQVVAGLGFQEPAPSIVDAAPVADPRAPSAEAVPEPAGAATLVDERMFRSREGRFLAQQANQHGTDKAGLFGVLANLVDPVLKVPPGERQALQAAIVARLDALPDPARPARAPTLPHAPESPLARPTEAAPAPAEGGLEENTETRADERPSNMAYGLLESLETGDIVHTAEGDFTFDGRHLVRGRTRIRVRAPDKGFRPDERAVAIARHGGTQVEVPERPPVAAAGPRVDDAEGSPPDKESTIPSRASGNHAPRGARVRGVEAGGTAVEGRLLKRLEMYQSGSIRSSAIIVTDDGVRLPVDGLEILDPTPVPVLKARKTDSRKAFLDWWENRGPYSEQVKAGSDRYLETEYKPNYFASWREGVERAELDMPRPSGSNDGMGQSSGWDWRMSLPDARARAESARKVNPGRSDGSDGPVNLLGEREQPVVEQAGLFSARDLVAGEKAAADRISGRKMTADEVVASTREEGRTSLEGGDRSLFADDETPDVPDLGGTGSPSATAILAPPRPRKSRGITPVRPDHVDTPPEGAADNAVYRQVRESARGIPDHALRERYLRNLRLAIDAGSDAEARPSRTVRIDRDDKDVPIYKPVSAGAEHSRWNRTNSEARLAAYANELRARGLEEPHPDDAFRDVEPDEIPEHLRPLAQETREAETADELRTMLYAAEQRAMRDPRAVVDRAIVAGEMRARGIPTSTREMTDAGDFAGALAAKVLPHGPGLGPQLRRVLEEHITDAGRLSDRELVQRAIGEGVVDNPAYRAAVAVLDDYGFWRIGGRLAFDPLIGAALGMFGGGIAGGRMDRKDPLRGALAGATAGAFVGAGLAAGGALAGRMVREARAAGAARDVSLARELHDELHGAASSGRIAPVSMDDPRLRLETPAARRRRNPGGIGQPLPNRPAEPEGSSSGFWQILRDERGAWDLSASNAGDLNALLEPRVQLEERPRGLGIVETWMRSPRELFAKYDPQAARIADLAARALDERNRYLDLRRVQVQNAMAGLSKADKTELWRALDRYAVVSDVPMRVKQRVRDAFVAVRGLFRDDVMRLFQMKRNLLSKADRKTLDTAIANGLRETTLPETFPEHLRPLVAMHTGEWGIAAYWPHVFDGNWKVHAGEHTSYFSTRNEAEAYAKRLINDGQWKEDVPVTYSLAVSGDMATVLPRDRYFALVNQLRASLGLNTGSVVSKLDGTVRMGPRRKFLAHERQRAVDLKTFEQDPETALDLYYHRWATKLAFDPFRVRSARLLERVDKNVVGLVDEVDDYIRRVQGLPGKNELAFDHAVQRSVLWLTHGLVETKPFLARRAANLATDVMAFARLGFSPVSAALNLTQTVINTAPYVGERWAVRGAREAREFFWTRTQGMQGKSDEALEGMLRDSGALTLHPKHLVGHSDALRPESWWGRTKTASMYLFDSAERVNRVIAAIAAFRKAEAEGMAYREAVEYAREVQRKTQFRYDAADAPRIAAGPLGRVVSQFQTYAVKEIEFMADLARTDRKAFAKAITYYAALAGVRGLLVGTPLWALDALAGNLGVVKEDGVKKRPSEWATEHLPGPLVFGALGTLFGSDLSERMGAGTARDFTEGKEGPALGTVADLYRARQAWASGDNDRAEFFLKRAAPSFLSRLATAFQVYETGEMRDSWGRSLRDATGADAVRTGLGAKGWETTREWDRESIRMRDQGARSNTAGRARSQIFDALDRGDMPALERAISDAQAEGVFIAPDEIKRGYMERRNPRLRAIRRTRGADRRRLLDAEILEVP